MHIACIAGAEPIETLLAPDHHCMRIIYIVLAACHNPTGSLTI